jgi:uncharacterized protein
LHTLTISWFGGEPLLEASRVLQISRFARDISVFNNSTFAANITTNGYLLHYDLFEELVSAGINRFQISLDGTEVEHNHTRRIANSVGSYEAIMNNLLSMRRSSKMFDIILRLHVHDGNPNSVIDLVDHIGLEFKNDTRFKVNIQKILNYAGEQKFSLKEASNDTIERVVKHVADVLPRSKICNRSDVLQCCYASLPNHFVIRANGKVQKCTVALYDKRNDVGQLMPDGSINWFGQEKLRAWSMGLLEGDLDKMRCPWQVMRREVM